MGSIKQLNWALAMFVMKFCREVFVNVFEVLHDSRSQLFEVRLQEFFVLKLCILQLHIFLDLLAL